MVTLTLHGTALSASCLALDCLIPKSNKRPLPPPTQERPHLLGSVIGWGPLLSFCEIVAENNFPTLEGGNFEGESFERDSLEGGNFE